MGLLAAGTIRFLENERRLTSPQCQPRPPEFLVKEWYDIQEILGEGAYGKVYLALRKTDGEVVALKRMSRQLTNEGEFQREVSALQLLSSHRGGHPHVCKLYDLHSDEKNYYLAMELIAGGELMEHLIRNGPYSEAQAAKFLRQFAEAISFVHIAGLTHADLKLENLMMSLNDDERAQLKVVDFGCAIRTSEGESQDNDAAQQEATGTTAYWPPELFVNGAIPTPASDMWATGCIVYILLTGSHPFDKYGNATDEEVQETILKVCEPGYEHLLAELVFDDRVEGLSASCLELMRVLLHPEPAKRMTSDEFLRHPWVQGLTASWSVMTDTHRKLEAFWQKRFRAEIVKKFSAKIDNTGKGELSVRDLTEIFQSLDTNGDGVLQPEEIISVFRDLGVKGKDIEEVFAMVDLDGTGVLHLEEFLTLMRARFDDGPGLRVHYRQQQFRSDILKKFATMSSSEEKLREIFNSMDLDGSGVLDGHEIRVALRASGEEDEDDISAIVASVDLNHDGGISWEEFREIMLSKDE
jgi:serine/threonine protein kinase